MASTKTSALLKEKYNLIVRATPGFKQWMAERVIREIKTRTALLLDLEQRPLQQWKDVLERVVNVINRDKKTYRNPQEFLTSFFTSQSILFPYHSIYFKYKVGDLVRINLPANERRSFTFRYALHPGIYQRIFFSWYEQ